MRQRQLLIFPSRKHLSVCIKLFSDRRVNPVIHPVDTLFKPAPAQRRFDNLVVTLAFGSEQNVLLHAHGKAVIILKKRRKHIAIRLKTDIRHGDTVYEDSAVGGVIKPQEELDKRCFACAVQPDYGNLLALLQPKRQMLQGIIVGTVITE